VLITTKTSGVGQWDTDMREGWSPTGRRPRFPLVLELTARALLLRSAHASGDSPWGDPVYAAGFLYAFERGGHRRWEASSGFYAEYVAVSAAGVAHVPKGLALEHAGASPRFRESTTRSISSGARPWSFMAPPAGRRA
jgi:NADPH:quinone reductase-like Zn-dependent oxidoreductase